MNIDPSGVDRSHVPLITFGLAWGILGLFILLPEPMVSIFGELTGQHPLFFLAVWAPAIAFLWEGYICFVEISRVNENS